MTESGHRPTSRTAISSKNDYKFSDAGESEIVKSDPFECDEGSETEHNPHEAVFKD